LDKGLFKGGDVWQMVVGVPGWLIALKMVAVKVWSASLVCRLKKIGIPALPA
jgi:uncharacterized membrane protein